MKPLKFAIFGTGFWSRFQLAAWRELPNVECVALYNRTLDKARNLGREFGVESIYDDAEELLNNHQIDFADIITDVSTHETFVELCADRGIPVICQKPMAPSLEVAERLVKKCQSLKIPFFVHENFRWQRPIRQVKQYLETGVIGSPYRAQIDFRSSFPVFDNQPFLKQIEQFILTDVGTHILDVARFLFGEAQSLHCHTHQFHKDIAGEDVATVMMKMNGGVSVVCNMGYATPLKTEAFPQTLIHIEGSKGSLDLEKDYSISITDSNGSTAERFPPKNYPWVDPAYAVVHSSIVDCNANILSGIRGESTVETTAEDNLKTLRLVFEAYEKAEK